MSAQDKTFVVKFSISSYYLQLKLFEIKAIYGLHQQNYSHSIVAGGLLEMS